MDQFGMDLGHGEIGQNYLTDAQADEKFSPRRTRSGRVFDSNCLKTLRQRRRSQDSFRSRNSSGQSGTGSSEDASEQDDCINDINCHDNYEEVLSCLNRNPRCRLDLCQEIPISPPSAFMFDEHLLSPKKYQQVSTSTDTPPSSPLRSPTLPMKRLHLTPTYLHKMTSSWTPSTSRMMECDSTSSEHIKVSNINPFSPSARSGSRRKRVAANCQDKLPWSVPDNQCFNNHSQDDLVSSKRLRVSDINISRYEEEFVEIEKIASGEFGVVWKARHRLDGMLYAIKMTKTPLRDNSRSEKTAMREIFAGAAMMKHKHVVRYYNSWVEDGTVFIQNEYCDGGSLQSVIESHRETGQYFLEEELRQILLDICHGLHYVHSKHLAHLDVKPGNILMSRDDMGELTYKLADFGHVVPLQADDVEPEEGDCRYMAPELLALVIDRSRLTQADIFSLGLTLFEAASLLHLPRNSLDDPQYENIKNGQLPHLSRYSQELNDMISRMVQPHPDSRPSAEEIISFMIDPKIELYKEYVRTKQRLSCLEDQLKLPHD